MTTGLITELEVKTAATKLGIIVSTPEGGQERYDQVWDMNGQLLRIQIKAPSEFEYGFQISGRASKKYSEDEGIAAFVTFYNDKLYYIPWEDVASSPMSFYTRLPKDRNGLKLIRWAEDFELKINNP